MKTFPLFKPFALGLMMLGLALSSGCASKPAAPQLPVTTQAIYTWESDGNGFNTRTFFYDNGHEVVAFDTQFTHDTALKSIEYLRTKTKNPITFVVITHPNPDKFNGMSVFQAQGAKVVASRRTSNALEAVHAYKKYYFVKIAKMFTDATYPELKKVDQVFDSQYDLRLGNGEVIQLAESGIAGVSSNQTTAFVTSQSALFVGDLVHHKAHAWLEGGIVNGKATPNIASWIKNLNELMKNYSPEAQVYGGRGQTASLKEAGTAQIKYLEKADKLVGDFVKKLGKKSAELSAEKAQSHYAALTKEFEKAFPDYALSYMIQYGAYGLANSKIKTAKTK